MGRVAEWLYGLAVLKDTSLPVVRSDVHLMREVQGYAIDMRSSGTVGTEESLSRQIGGTLQSERADEENIRSKSIICVHSNQPRAENQRQTICHKRKLQLLCSSWWIFLV